MAPVFSTRVSAWQQRHDPIVRLELHPGDDQPRVRRAWASLLCEQAETRQMHTLRDVAAGLRAVPGRVPS